MSSHSKETEGPRMNPHAPRERPKKGRRKRRANLLGDRPEAGGRFSRGPSSTATSSAGGSGGASRGRSRDGQQQQRKQRSDGRRRSRSNSRESGAGRSRQQVRETSSTGGPAAGGGEGHDPASSGTAHGDDQLNGQRASGNEQEKQEIEPTSRLCVRNLPFDVDNEALKKHFSSQGIVTDAKVMTKRTGASRRFGFVGFRTVEEATQARRYFNRSYHGSFRLDVQFAHPRGSSQLPRPWSKFSSGSSAHQQYLRNKALLDPNVNDGDDGSSSVASGASKSNGGSIRSAGDSAKDSSFADPVEVALIGVPKEQAAKLREDPRFLEFVSVMQPRSATKFWENDDTPLPSASVDPNAVDFDDSRQKVTESFEEWKRRENAAAVAGASSSDDDDDDEEDVFDPSASRIAQSSGSEDDSDEEANVTSLAKDSSVSDMAYFQSLKGGLDEDSDSDEERGAASRKAASAAPSGGGSGDGSSDSDSDSEDGGSDNSNGGSNSEDSDDDSDDEDNASNSNKSSQKASSKRQDVPEEIHVSHEDAIMDSSRLFLRNLPFNVSEEDITELGERFGNVEDVLIPKDDTQRGKGYALLQFQFPQHAVMAWKQLNQTIFQGRLLHVLPAHARPQTREEALEQELKDNTQNSLTFKKKQELKRRLAAEKSDNWNSLFLRADTVAESIAHKYGVEKSDVLDSGADNMAVRLALAETHLVAETKEFLAEHGVDLQAFSGPKSKTKRSRNVILIKNIPFSAEEHELRHLFEPHGHLNKLVMPPSKTMALVEFSEAREAKRAFRALAYKKFHHVPLYLEMAPQGALNGTIRASSQKAQPTRSGASAAAAAAAAAAEGAAPASSVVEQVTAMDDAADGDATGQKVLYVKNLHFDTTEEELQRHFRSVGQVRAATIAKKPNFKKSGPEKDKPWLSQGYGFVEFTSADDAARALRTMQGAKLDGHALKLKLSGRGSQGGNGPVSGPTAMAGRGKKRSAPGHGKNPPSSKIIVKNVAFEANAKDLRELFGAFGQIKRCRMPKKYDGSHRGFAFIDFVTKQEAKNAVAALDNSHLYGRHLVLEWAKEDETLEELRDKTTQSFNKRQKQGKAGVSVKGKDLEEMLAQ